MQVSFGKGELSSTKCVRYLSLQGEQELFLYKGLHWEKCLETFSVVLGDAIPGPPGQKGFFRA